MERPVSVKVSLTMDLQLQPDQTEDGLARTVHQQIDQLLKPHRPSRIDHIKVFEGHGDLPTWPQPKPLVELVGMQDWKCWQLIRRDPNKPLGYDPTNPLVPLRPRGTYVLGPDTTLLGRRRHARRVKEDAKLKKNAALQKAERSTVPNFPATTKQAGEKKFKHDFDDPSFNKRLRTSGIRSAFAPDRVKRLKEIRKDRRGRDEERRWIGHVIFDEKEKMDILTDDLAAAFDFNTPVPSKAESKVAGQSLANSVVLPKADDGMDTSDSTKMAQGSTRTTPGADDEVARMFEVFK